MEPDRLNDPTQLIGFVVDEGSKNNTTIRVHEGKVVVTDALKGLCGYSSTTATEKFSVIRKEFKKKAEENPSFVDPLANIEKRQVEAKMKPVYVLSGIELTHVVHALPSGRYSIVDRIKQMSKELFVRYVGADTRVGEEIAVMNAAYASGAIPANHPLQVFRQDPLVQSGLKEKDKTEEMLVAALKDLEIVKAKNAELEKWNEELLLSVRKEHRQKERIENELGTNLEIAAKTRVVPIKERPEKDSFLLIIKINREIFIDDEPDFIIVRGQRATCRAKLNAVVKKYGSPEVRATWIKVPYAVNIWNSASPYLMRRGIIGHHKWKNGGKRTKEFRLCAGHNINEVIEHINATLNKKDEFPAVDSP